MKKILFSLIAYLSTLQIALAEQKKHYLDQMLPNSQDVLVKWDNAEDQVDNFLFWVRDSIDTLLPITAIGVFLFVGIRLGLARWNPEEFKKSWMQFIYAIVGIFVVSFAWAAVKLVAGINIF